MKRTPLRRSAMRRCVLPPRTAPVLVPLTAPVRMWRPADVVVSVPKDRPWRCEAYRRLVASMPCLMCWVHGYSQAAHANTGKGMGTKASDYRVFPLCGPRFGEIGCHAAFDQGALFPKAERREWEEWAIDRTRAMAIERGWRIKEAA